ncbi:DUF4097 family beta strand repeat-containing protein [Microbacterium mangrovi]|uniref:DUF4097 family beta strand repeat-containing protein n=1 Tax=Microbacterium mangrovi TaxID=1348253 RepID=UPI0018CC9914|nr:DUF4097 family beta strand repeat-containing protein [Microbacterium mangrovi]
MPPPTVPTPPPAPPAPGGQPPARRTSSLIVSIAIAVVGGLIVVGTVAGVALSTVAVANRHQDSTAVPVAEVSALDIQVSGGSLTVTYGSTSEAQLTVDRGFGSTPWTLENVGGTLKVASPDHATAFGWPFGGSGTATLTLPSSMLASDVDGTVQVDGGSVSLEGGRFGDLRAATEAGSLRLSGSAQTVTARSDAGDSTLDLDNVTTAKLDVSAGRMVATLGGTAPRGVDATVSAGALDLGVPAGPYVVTSTVSAGAFHNTLGSTPGATNAITADVSAGALTLHGSAG